MPNTAGRIAQPSEQLGAGPGLVLGLGSCWTWGACPRLSRDCRPTSLSDSLPAGGRACCAALWSPRYPGSLGGGDARGQRGLERQPQNRHGRRKLWWPPIVGVGMQTACSMADNGGLPELLETVSARLDANQHRGTSPAPVQGARTETGGAMPQIF